MPGPLSWTAPAICACSIFAALLSTGTAEAAGPWLTETGASDMGVASAGRAATAADAGGLAGNPATLGTLEYATVTTALVPLDLDFEFRGTDGFAGRGTNHADTIVLPAAYAVTAHDRWTWGVGAYSGFGLEFDLGDDWGGERAVEQAALVTFNLGPAVALDATERLTLGGSIAAQWAQADFRLAVANDWLTPGQPAADGRLKVTGDDWALGGQLGLTYELREGTSLGASWTAPVSHDATLDLEGRGLHPAFDTLLPADGVARLDFTLPQQVLLGASHRVGGGKTTVTGGLAWQDWSQFGNARLALPGANAPLFPDGLVDTWGLSLGVRHPIDDGWTVAAGAGYESSPAPRAGVPVYFPTAEQWKLSLGLEHSVAESLRIRVAASVILQGDAWVNQYLHPLPLPGIPQFTGVYESTRLYAVGLAADFNL